MGTVLPRLPKVEIVSPPLATLRSSFPSWPACRGDNIFKRLAEPDRANLLALNPKPSITISLRLFHIGDLQHLGIFGMSGNSEPLGSRRCSLLLFGVQY